MQAPLTRTVPYFGAKADLAGRIIELRKGRPTSWYTELFHGSCAMLLAVRDAGYAGPAVVSDLNWYVSTLAWVLSHTDECRILVDQLAPLPLSESVYRQALERLDNATRIYKGVPSGAEWRVALARDYLIASWMGRNGEAGLDRPWLDQLSGYCVRWNTRGGDPARRWASLKESIPEWWSLMCEHTTYLCRDAIDVLSSSHNRAGHFIYADPPYLHETRGAARYLFDAEDGTGTFAEDDDFHAKLAGRLATFDACDVVVSYYEHERLDRLYPAAKGWVHQRATLAKKSAQTGGDSKKGMSPEVLIYRLG